MTYRDMTFCSFWEDCAEPCSRALTPEVIKKANEWLENAPISRFLEKPDCWKGKETTVQGEK